MQAPKAIIGLGNVGHQYALTRHNIGFRIIDSLAQSNGGTWREKEIMEIAQIQLSNQSVILIKPLTFMNNSGKVTPYLQKMGIKAEEILVIHDELELAFGKLALKQGGSAKGHNGLKSIISFIGENFSRLRFGIGRPENREDVPDYVLAPFTQVEEKQLPLLIDQAVAMI